MGLAGHFSKFPTRLALTLLVAAGCFAAGWWWGRQEDRTEPQRRPAPSTTVELHLDAGGVRLVPDGGLHLEPMEPLDPQDLPSER